MVKDSSKPKDLQSPVTKPASNLSSSSLSGVGNSGKSNSKAKEQETVTPASQVPWIKDDYYMQAGTDTKSHWDLDSD
jgi:hypothetical protein